MLCFAFHVFLPPCSWKSLVLFYCLPSYVLPTYPIVVILKYELFQIGLSYRDVNLKCPLVSMPSISLYLIVNKTLDVSKFGHSHIMKNLGYLQVFTIIHYAICFFVFWGGWRQTRNTWGSVPRNQLEG